MNPTLSLSEFYQSHLNRVSRSFSICIAELDEPLRQYVGLTYLLCRLVDTVEDSDWQSRAEQKNQFAQLNEFIEAVPSLEAYNLWNSKMPGGIPEDEILLLKDGHPLLSNYHLLPSDVRQIIHGPLVTMTRGMAAVLEKKSAQGLKLKNLLELNHYCFFVAGVVGEVLTRLVSHHYRVPQVFTPQILDSLHFGLFLQKINILKDRFQDSERGFFFFENSAEVVASLKNHATRAKQYLLSLPVQWKPYRVFCSFSLSLGLISLPFILSPMGLEKKIPRDQTKLLLNHLKEVVQDNSELDQFLQTWIDDISQYEAPAVATAEPTESRFNPSSVYEGLLSEQELQSYFQL